MEFVYLQNDSNRQRSKEYDSDIISENQMKDSRIEDLTRVSHLLHFY